MGVDGGPTRWIGLADKPGTFYLNQASWAGSSDKLLVEKLSRYRDAREFLLVEHRTGAIAKAYAESNPAWVDMGPSANEGLEWICGGQAFVVISKKDGWRRAYVVSRDGSGMRPITPAGSDLIVPAKWMTSTDGSTMTPRRPTRHNATSTARDWMEPARPNG